MAFKLTDYELPTESVDIDSVVQMQEALYEAYKRGYSEGTIAGHRIAINENSRRGDDYRGI